MSKFRPSLARAGGAAAALAITAAVLPLMSNPAVAAGYSSMPKAQRVYPDARVPLERGGPVLGTYYTNWSVFDDGRAFKPWQIPGVDRLDLINYGFIDVKGGACQLLDPYPDVQNTFNGRYQWKSDQVDAGNLRVMQELKDANPYLHVVASVGGWTKSVEFPVIAADPAKRVAFAQSCVNLMQQYGMDGLDIDWEFPVTGGDSSIFPNQSAADRGNFTLLMKELRAALDAAGVADARHYLLTAATQPSATAATNSYELAEIGKYLDHVNVMAYDYNGAWGPVANHNAPLHSAAKDGLSVAEAVQGYIAAGLPANKIVLGLGAYGRSFADVAELGRTDTNAFAPPMFSGKGRGTWEAGVVDYDDVANNILTKPTVVRAWDPEAKVPYAYDSASRTWYSYDDPISIQLKANLVKQLGLAGSYFWEASGDRTGRLLNAAVTGMDGQVPAEPYALIDTTTRDAVQAKIAAGRTEATAGRWATASLLAIDARTTLPTVADDAMRAALEFQLAELEADIKAADDSAVAVFKKASDKVLAATTSVSASGALPAAQDAYDAIPVQASKATAKAVLVQAKAHLAWLTAAERFNDAAVAAAAAKEAAQAAQKAADDAATAHALATRKAADASQAAADAQKAAGTAKAASTLAADHASTARAAAVAARAAAVDDVTRAVAQQVEVASADADAAAGVAAKAAADAQQLATDAAVKAQEAAQEETERAAAAKAAADAAVKAQAEADAREQERLKALVDADAAAKEAERIEADKAAAAAAKAAAEEQARLDAEAAARAKEAAAAAEAKAREQVNVKSAAQPNPASAATATAASASGAAPAASDRNADRAAGIAVLYDYLIATTRPAIVKATLDVMRGEAAALTASNPHVDAMLAAGAAHLASLTTAPPSTSVPVTGITLASKTRAGALSKIATRLAAAGDVQHIVVAGPIRGAKRLAAAIRDRHGLTVTVVPPREGQKMTYRVEVTASSAL